MQAASLPTVRPADLHSLKHINDYSVRQLRTLSVLSHATPPGLHSPMLPPLLAPCLAVFVLLHPAQPPAEAPAEPAAPATPTTTTPPTSTPTPAPASPVPTDEDHAEVPPRTDAATGRDLSNFPPSPGFDFLHLRLDMTIADPSVTTFEGEVAISARALGQARGTMRLDAGPGLTIHSVVVDGLPAKFERAERAIEIVLPEPAKPDGAAPITVVITYTAKDTEQDGAGLVFRKPTADGKPAQIFSQGQPDMNRLWIPCFDFPSDRLSSELIVRVPEGFTVVSNGRLAETRTQAGVSTWHWVQSQPHPAYLIMVAVSTFDRIDLNPDDGSPDGPPSNPRLPMAVYGPPGTAETMKRVYAATPAMMKFFERVFDEPYPWDKYDQVVVRSFNWGGMENTSASIMSDITVRLPLDQNDLIAHELAHQWLGNLLTCRTWAHLWLNEGWATFAEALWAEHDKGEAGYRATLVSSVRSMRRAYARRPAEMPGSVAMASNRYRVPDDTFTKTDDPYAKGGFVLHMLRKRLGDDAFFRGLRLYIDRFKFAQVETDDFRRVMEEVSGESLERFFAQWVHRAGVPNLKVTSEWIDADKTLQITIEQTQPVNDDNPAYDLAVPIRVIREGGEPMLISVQTQERTVTARYPLATAPAELRVDPDMTILANFKFEGLKARAW